MEEYELSEGSGSEVGVRRMVCFGGGKGCGLRWGGLVKRYMFSLNFILEVDVKFI